jgi:hypothetical protein
LRGRDWTWRLLAIALRRFLLGNESFQVERGGVVVVLRRVASRNVKSVVTRVPLMDEVGGARVLVDESGHAGRVVECVRHGCDEAE